MASLRAEVVGGVAGLSRERWNSLLSPEATPFVDWRWLSALEASGCASAEAGWRPRHLALYRGRELVAAAPAYVKDDSDGDFSRDFDLADAVQRSGRPYYPKLVLGVPFTPVTGQRLLVLPGEELSACAQALVEAARDLAEREGCPTFQLLFPTPSEARLFADLGLALRVSHQYHWQNDGYPNYDAFLARFPAKRRHALRRERAAAAGHGIALRTVRGDGLRAGGPGLARAAHALHQSTVAKLLWGRGWLNEGFYERVFEAMPERLELVLAERAGRLVAGAFNVASERRLYGRYWGCLEDHPFLHFNVCYYHSIDDCIQRGLDAFEGGAGGEHKLSRGFLPAETWSAHGFLAPEVGRALSVHLERETQSRREGLRQFLASSPVFKERVVAA
ncbi:MAG: GNAT family N-acetyltransferase [Deltaproteobacteria bacterium]